MTKLESRDYMALALEALPLGIPLVVDYAMKRKVEEHSKHLFSKDNLEHTKNIAMTIRQQLYLDPKYSTFHYFDGVLTRKTKESIKSVLDKLEEKRREELLSKIYLPLKNIEVDTPSKHDIIGIPPEY